MKTMANNRNPRPAEDEPSVIERADPAVQHPSDIRKVMRLHHDQRDNEDAGGEHHLDDVGLIDIGWSTSQHLGVR